MTSGHTVNSQRCPGWRTNCCDCRTCKTSAWPYACSDRLEMPSVTRRGPRPAAVVDPVHHHADEHLEQILVVRTVLDGLVVDLGALCLRLAVGGERLQNAQHLVRCGLLNLSHVVFTPRQCTDRLRNECRWTGLSRCCPSCRCCNRRVCARTSHADQHWYRGGSTHARTTGPRRTRSA